MYESNNIQSTCCSKIDALVSYWWHCKLVIVLLRSNMAAKGMNPYSCNKNLHEEVNISNIYYSTWRGGMGIAT